METSYTKWDNSEQVNVLMEGQNRAQGRKGFRISEFFTRKVIYYVILGIGFLCLIALLSHSLRNESKLFKAVELKNAESSDSLPQMFFNLSKEVSGIALKIEALQAESKNEPAESKLSKAVEIKNAQSSDSLQQMFFNLSKEVSGIALKIDSLQAESRNEPAGTQMTKENLNPLREEVAKLREENRRIAEDATRVLEGLHNWTATQMTKENLSPLRQEVAKLRDQNRRIAEDATQVLEGLHNLTDFLCTKCPPDWVPFDRNCYFFSVLSEPWLAGKESCEKEGAHLVIINSHREMTFLVNQLLNDEVFWIGLSDAGKEGQWVWVDGTPLAFSFWGQGEPNNAGHGEDCATLRFNGKWNDAFCSRNDMWICERKC